MLETIIQTVTSFFSTLPMYYAQEFRSQQEKLTPAELFLGRNIITPFKRLIFAPDAESQTGKASFVL